MEGIVGRLFREFALTLSIAILISMVISLTATPTMCAHLIRPDPVHGRLYEWSERAFRWVVNAYGRSLSTVLRYSGVTLGVLIATIALNVYLYVRVPKGFFPQQDTGRIVGAIQADQDTSFQAMNRTLLQMVNIIQADPAVDNVNGYVGGGTMNTSRMFLSLKPLEVRKVDADLVIARLRPKLSRIPGASLYMQSSQDVRVGGHQSNAQYQYTMVSDNLRDLTRYGPLMLRELRSIPIIADVNSDQQNRGLQALVDYDRDTAARFGISSQLMDNVLYDAFGQRQVSTMYGPLNQYHVVMEAAPEFWQNPGYLNDVYVKSPGGEEIPLSALAQHNRVTAPLAVDHQGLFPAVTISFNLRAGVPLGDAVDAINEAAARIRLPSTVTTGFAAPPRPISSPWRTEPLLDFHCARLRIYCSRHAL